VNRYGLGKNGNPAKNGTTAKDDHGNTFGNVCLIATQIGTSEMTFNLMPFQIESTWAMILG
jgi:hypothetical protein